MFWSNEQLKDELRLRLRVAADFATLGAYELSGPDEDDEPVPAGEDTLRRDLPQRVFLFAKVAPVCPHSATPARACTERATLQRSTRQRRKLRQRGGAVRTPDQPCMCAAERVPTA